MGKGKTIDQLNALELQQALAHLTKLHARQEPHALAVLDVLANWIQMAENPGDPNYMAARNLIGQWVQLHERMRAIASGIQLPKQ